MSEQEDFLRPLIREVPKVVEIEMLEALCAEKGERAEPARLPFWILRTDVGDAGGVPQDRQRALSEGELIVSMAAKSGAILAGEK